MNRKIKRSLAAMLALLMLLSLAACGGEKVPSERVGSYKLYEMSEDGMTFDNETLKMFDMEDLLLLELKEDGTGILTSDGESENIKWTDAKISASNGLESYEYTYQDGKITLEIDGITAVLQKTGGKSNALPEGKKEASGDNEPASELQQWWSGDWYGWYNMISAYGSWEELDGAYYDCCAEIVMYDDATGVIRIWDETFTKDVTLAECELSFGPGTTSAGAFMSESGEFIDAPLAHADWIVDPGASMVSQYDHMICIDGSYDDPEDEGGFDYLIFLRPWGMDWEDVAADDAEMLPISYADWYLPLIEAGEEMPDEIGGSAGSAPAEPQEPGGDYGMSTADADGMVDSTETLAAALQWVRKEAERDVTTYEEISALFGVPGIPLVDSSNWSEGRKHAYQWVDGNGHNVTVQFHLPEDGVERYDGNVSWAPSDLADFAS